MTSHRQPDVLAETIKKLTAHRDALARDLTALLREQSSLDAAIDALRTVRDAPREASMVPSQPRAVPSPGPAPLPAPAIPAPPPRPAVCALTSCGKPLPPPNKKGGRPRAFCSKACNKKATKLRARAADDEDPTDRAIRLHKELHPVPESGSGYRGRAKGARA